MFPSSATGLDVWAGCVRRVDDILEINPRTVSVFPHWITPCCPEIVLYLCRRLLGTQVTLPTEEDPAGRESVQGSSC